MRGQPKGNLWGKDCIAANIVLSMNKMRYKDAKGDPRGFVIFLEKEKLPCGILPRYRGNRLHILFHICGVLVEHYEKFQDFLQRGTARGGLRTSLLKDFMLDIAHVEMHVLGLIGKLLTGGWMKKIYRGAEDQVDHVEAISLVKDVVENLNVDRDPLYLLGWTNDFLGDALPVDVSDSTLKSLRQKPKDPELFKVMMRACFHTIVEVLERQYRRYFDIDVTEKLKEETKSARTHNIDAEEVMEMFSAAQQRTTNATVCYMSSKLRSRTNKTVDYLDAMAQEKRDTILKKATKIGLKQQRQRRQNQRDIRMELKTRQDAKQQTREMAERNQLEKKLKNLKSDELAENFPELAEERLEGLFELLTGKCVGRNICHVWNEDGAHQVYNGKIEKLKGKGKVYVVGYWAQNELYDDATDYNMSVYALAADWTCDDLMM